MGLLAHMHVHVSAHTHHTSPRRCWSHSAFRGVQEDFFLLKGQCSHDPSEGVVSAGQ